MARRRLIVAGLLTGGVLAVGAGAVGVLDRGTVTSLDGCSVERCYTEVIMKAAATRADAMTARQEYAAISGMHVGRIRSGRVSITVRRHGQFRPRGAQRYSFEVSSSDRDPAEVDVRDASISAVFEPL
jgi:hypothetical protein